MEAEQDSGIDGLKQILIETLETQGRLSAIKADVRATVFTALNTKLDDGSRVAKRKTNSKIAHLLRNEEGTQALEGVIELLRWAGLNQTLRVLECELPLTDSVRLREAFSPKKALPETPTLVNAGGHRDGVPSDSLPQIGRTTPNASPLSAKAGQGRLPALSSPIGKSDSPGRAPAGQAEVAEDRDMAAPASQLSSASVYSEITEEIEEVLSYVEEGESSAIDIQDSHRSLHPMDSTTLDVVNSMLSASDHSGELDSDVEGIEAAELS